ncbi:MAG TPA: DUF1579 family protein [Candidatus Angelobacter sp.]|nr:DUF1579 family protein [Candidatus Angelobacter sp.]
MHRISMNQRISALAVAFALFFAITGAAQNPPAMPKPGPELKKLEYFVGSWKTTANMKATPYGPGGPFTGLEQVSWMDGHFFLILHSHENSAMGKSSTAAVMGYDPEEKVYTYDEYNSMGEAGHSKGTVEGDTWTWTSTEKMEGKSVRGRFVMKIVSPTEYTFSYAMAPEGGDFNTVMEGKTVKILAAAKK